MSQAVEGCLGNSFCQEVGQIENWQIENWQRGSLTVMCVLQDQQLAVKYLVRRCKSRPAWSPAVKVWVLDINCSIIYLIIKVHLSRWRLIKCLLRISPGWHGSAVATGVKEPVRQGNRVQSSCLLLLLIKQGMRNQVLYWLLRLPSVKNLCQDLSLSS